MIVSTPECCGGDARISGTRITVWGLEEARRIVGMEERVLAMYPSLTIEDLWDAWDYVTDNPAEIDDAIAENQRDH